jgi:hypothetical protein
MSKFLGLDTSLKLRKKWLGKKAVKRDPEVTNRKKSVKHWIGLYGTKILLLLFSFPNEVFCWEISIRKYQNEVLIFYHTWVLSLGICSFYPFYNLQIIQTGYTEAVKTKSIFDSLSVV